MATSLLIWSAPLATETVILPEIPLTTADNAHMAGDGWSIYQMNTNTKQVSYNIVQSAMPFTTNMKYGYI